MAHGIIARNSVGSVAVLHVEADTRPHNGFCFSMLLVPVFAPDLTARISHWGGNHSTDQAESGSVCHRSADGVHLLPYFPKGCHDVKVRVPIVARLVGHPAARAAFGSMLRPFDAK